LISFVIEEGVRYFLDNLYNQELCKLKKNFLLNKN